MFIFIKKIIYIASLSLVSATPLSCISLKNQECKVKLLILILIILYFILLVLKEINVVATVIALIIHMQKFVFLIL